MSRADVDGGAVFTTPTTMAAISAAGIVLNAVTDADLGDDVCRAVCSVSDQDGEIVTSYRVEFLQATVIEALDGRAPSWQGGSPWNSEQNNGSAARLRATQARAIASLFSADEQTEISGYARDWQLEAVEP